MGLILVIYAINVGLFRIYLSTSWFLYLLVLVFLGGIMILIIYMSSLSANEKFYPRSSTVWILGIIVILFTRQLNLSVAKGHNKFVLREIIINQLYFWSNFSRIIFLIIYLFITIVCIVKLVKFENGPLTKRL